MSGAKEFVLVCLVLLVISCLTSAQPATQENKITDVYDQFRKREQQSVDDLTQLNQAPRMSRSVKYAPYLVSGESQFIEKVNQKAIRSPSLRLRFGRRNDPDFPPNFDLLNEEFQQEANNNQQMLSPFPSGYSQQETAQKRYPGFARQERKPARLRWGRSAPGEFSSARDQVMDAMAALARDQRSKTSRLRWGRSGPPTYNNEWKDFTDNELVTLAIQYLINKQHLQERMAENEANQQQLVPATEEDETNAKN